MVKCCCIEVKCSKGKGHGVFPALDDFDTAFKDSAANIIKHCKTPDMQKFKGDILDEPLVAGRSVQNHATKARPDPGRRVVGAGEDHLPQRQTSDRRHLCAAGPHRLRRAAQRVLLVDGKQDAGHTNRHTVHVRDRGQCVRSPSRRLPRSVCPVWAAPLGPIVLSLRWPTC